MIKNILKVFTVVLMSVLLFSCKKGEDGNAVNPGEGYFRVTYTETTFNQVADKDIPNLNFIYAANDLEINASGDVQNLINSCVVEPISNFINFNFSSRTVTYGSLINKSSNRIYTGRLIIFPEDIVNGKINTFYEATKIEVNGKTIMYYVKYERIDIKTICPTVKAGKVRSDINFANKSFDFFVNSNTNLNGKLVITSQDTDGKLQGYYEALNDDNDLVQYPLENSDFNIRTAKLTVNANKLFTKYLILGDINLDTSGGKINFAGIIQLNQENPEAFTATEQ
jgi:hypothetical protein